MVTVIIPFRNAARWIERCYKSTQQEGNFEIIFVNDNSTDGGEKLVPCINNEHAPGVSGARNTGLDHAKGSWITFLDADDELLPNAYSKFERMLETDALMYQSNHIRHYCMTGQNINRWANHEGDYDLSGLPLIWFGVWNKLYSAELLKGIRFIEGMQYGEDELFNLECLQKAKRIHCVKNVVVKHNIENMQSLSHIRSSEDLMRELAELANFMLRAKDIEIREVAFDTLKLRIDTAWYRKEILDRSR